MKIEAVSKSEDVSLSGKREVWVHVFANEVYDWPSIEEKLGGPQRAMLDGLGEERALEYHPHLPDASEREEHGYSFEDWFVWRSR